MFSELCTYVLVCTFIFDVHALPTFFEFSTNTCTGFIPASTYNGPTNIYVLDSGHLTLDTHFSNAEKSSALSTFQPRNSTVQPFDSKIFRIQHLNTGSFVHGFNGPIHDVMCQHVNLHIQTSTDSTDSTFHKFNHIYTKQIRDIYDKQPPPWYAVSTRNL